MIPEGLIISLQMENMIMVDTTFGNVDTLLSYMAKNVRNEAPGCVVRHGTTPGQRIPNYAHEGEPQLVCGRNPTGVLGDVAKCKI